ncbi:hypothetical protein [Alicycliphilus denitrificans]|uniref:hypothetical protein n=1 Tax=Alicycliphilus denitrificans TaxID=179636 RepID=UPI003A809BFD
MSRSTAKPATQMAYITIGYSHFLMDASKAMKVAELMQHAVDVEWNYSGRTNGDTYTVGDPVNVEFRLVPANKIHMPSGEPAPVHPARPRLLR